MTRTQRNHRSSAASSGKGNGTIGQRRSQISRSLSKVLRHQAEHEGISITKEGWVRLSDLLSWRGLSDPGKFSPPVTTSEVMDVVEDDGINGKGRFGLKLSANDQSSAVSSGSIEADGAATGDMFEAAQKLNLEQRTGVTDASSDIQEISAGAPNHQASTTTSKNSPETLAVIAYQSEHQDEPASAYIIRATQGHSMKVIESEGLLTPIDLANPSSIPDTVVHGTFYGAWKSILSTGGLKPMSRNMVHFASGPSLSEVLPPLDANPATSVSVKSKQDVDKVLSQNKVISGMRWDAQILIYIDLKRLLHDIETHGWDMKWWRSDNGVILTEGVAVPEEPAKPEEQISLDTQLEAQNVQANPLTTTSESTGAQRPKPFPEAKANRPAKSHQAHNKGKADRIVPLAYFEAVVEIKAGIGILWRANDGIVNELPEHLSSKTLPRGKGLRSKGPETGAARGGKRHRPRVRVERDTYDLDGAADVGDRPEEE